MLVFEQAPETGWLVARLPPQREEAEPDLRAQRVVRSALRQFGVAGAFLSFSDGKAWYPAGWLGLAVGEISDWHGWCQELVTDHAMVRLHGSPATIGASAWRFAAGVPLVTSDGRGLGVLVLLDPVVRDFGEPDCAALLDLAALAADALAQGASEPDPSEQGLRLLATHLPDAAVMLDGNGVIQWANRLAEQLIGQSAATLLTTAIGQWLNSEASQRLDRLLRGASPAGRVDLGAWRDLALIRGDGLAVPVRLWLSRCSWAKQPGYLLILRDMREAAAEQTKLQAALDTADQAATVKNRFLSSISHEFRTPLNSIIGFAEMIELQMQTSDPTPQTLEYVRTIADAGRHLNEMVSDVLDLIRLDAGRMVLERRPVDAIAKLRQTLRLLDYQIKRKHLTLDLVLPDLEKVQIAADGRAYRQCLLNLLANAIKFTPDGGAVEVSLTVDSQDPTGPKLDITITDTGIGMAPSDLARLGEPFFRADIPNGPHVPGTGLGVAIVFRLVGAMGGTLQYNSSPGMGTMVRMRLPLADASRFTVARHG